MQKVFGHKGVHRHRNAQMVDLSTVFECLTRD